MIFVSEIAKRYASALFDSAADKTKAASILEELRAVESSLNGSADIKKFVESPLVGGDEKAKVLIATLNGKVSEDIKNLAAVMAENNRLTEWAGVVSAYQSKTDEANKVVRGTVKSASALGPDQRQVIETRVAQVTGKKVILEYKEEANLIGGLVAEVGSLTFDDSLETQLRLMNEELKRRSH